MLRIMWSSVCDKRKKSAPYNWTRWRRGCDVTDWRDGLVLNTVGPRDEHVRGVEPLDSNDVVLAAAKTKSSVQILGE